MYLAKTRTKQNLFEQAKAKRSFTCRHWVAALQLRPQESGGQAQSLPPNDKQQTKKSRWHRSQRLFVATHLGWAGSAHHQLF